MRNEYMRTLVRDLGQWYDKRMDLLEQKTLAIQNNNSEKVAEISEAVGKLNDTCPFTVGNEKAARAYLETNNNRGVILEMADYLYDNEIKDFLDTLDRAGITEFILTCESSVIKVIRAMTDCGWDIDGTGEVSRKYGSPVFGLVMKKTC